MITAIRVFLHNFTVLFDQETSLLIFLTFATSFPYVSDSDIEVTDSHLDNASRQINRSSKTKDYSSQINTHMMYDILLFFFLRLTDRGH